MRTTGVVKWFDRSTGLGVVTLDDGGDYVVVERHGVHEGRADASAPHRARCRGAGWRAYWPDVAEAARAGTWGDGGRDY